MVRTWCVLCILTWKCASRHNGVQLFITHLASWLRTRRFSEPTFRKSGATNHWKKHSESRLSYLFPHLHLLSSYSFSSELLSSNLSLLSASSLLCFSSVHIVGSLTSKLPSIIISNYHQRCSMPSSRAVATPSKEAPCKKPAHCPRLVIQESFQPYTFAAAADRASCPAAR